MRSRSTAEGNALSHPPAARERLASFVRAGRGLYLSGGSSSQNNSVEALVNTLVSGGGVDVGGVGISGAHSFNPDAVGGVTTRPNVLSSFTSSHFTRFITGLAPRNELVSIIASGDVPGAVWGDADMVGRRGRVTLLTNATWITPGGSLDVIENLQAFLQRQPEALPATLR